MKIYKKLSRLILEGFLYYEESYKKNFCKIKKIKVYRITNQYN